VSTGAREEEVIDETGNICRGKKYKVVDFIFRYFVTYVLKINFRISI
jgi:hypothetical protein